MAVRIQLRPSHSEAGLTPPRPGATGWLSGKEVVSVADVIRALGAPVIWLAVPQCVVRPEAAGRHWRGDERDQHWGGLGPLGDQLTQGVGRVHARPAFFQRLQLPQLLEPSHRHTKTNQQMFSSPRDGDAAQGKTPNSGPPWWPGSPRFRVERMLTMDFISCFCFLSPGITQ